MSVTNYNLRYSVSKTMFSKSLKLYIVFHLVMPMLVQNILDLASVLRAIHMQNSNHFLRVFVLLIGPFNSLMKRVDAWLIASLRGSIKFFLDVHVLPLVNPNLETRMHMCVVGLDFVYISQPTLECIIEEAKIQDHTPLDDFDQPSPPPIVP